MEPVILVLGEIAVVLAGIVCVVAFVLLIVSMLLATIPQTAGDHPVVRTAKPRRRGRPTGASSVSTSLPKERHRPVWTGSR